MTSVVDTSVKHFHSAMVGAPVLNGQAGSMIALLSACLVNGFDVKAGTSLTVASGIATLSFAGTHSAGVDCVILVTGASVAALNGEQKVKSAGLGFLTFATAAADGAATGAIAFKMAPAGWLSPFAEGHVAGFKSAYPMGKGMYLRVDDTGSYQARVVGYEQMPALNGGIGAFPSASMISGGGLWAKSFLATATPVPWVLFADGRMFYLCVAANFVSGGTYLGMIVRGFGDLIHRRPGGDPYACVLNCHADLSEPPWTGAMQGSFSSGAAAGRCFLPREHTGLAGAVAATAYPDTGGTGAMSGTDTRFGGFPGAFGELALSPKHVAASAASPPRADLPGIYHVPHSGVFDTFKTRHTLPGTGALAGRRLMIVSVAESAGAAYASNIGATAFDLTGPWR